MSTKRGGKKRKLTLMRGGRPKVLLIIGLVFSFLLASGTFARWSGFFSARQSNDDAATTQSLLPGSPSKEYVYAGSRLIPTEEPASTPGCTYSISPASQSFPSIGGTGTVAVTAGAGCSWTASSNVAWAHITSGASGSVSETLSGLMSQIGFRSRTTLPVSPAARSRMDL